jgi:hypothetical protein
MSKPKPRWLKLDKLARVRVRVASTKVEIRIIVPAERIRRQLDSLKPGE